MQVCLAGDCFVKQGEQGHEMFFIRSGEAEVTLANGAVVDKLKAGSFLGEMVLLYCIFLWTFFLENFWLCATYLIGALSCSRLF